QDYDFLDRLRAGEHLEVERSHPAADYTHAGFVGCHQSRATCRDRIEPGVKVTQFDSAIGLRTTGDDVAVAVGRGNDHALDRPPCLHTDDCNAHPAIRILRHRGKWSADGQHSCENLHDPFHADLLMLVSIFSRPMLQCVIRSFSRLKLPASDSLAPIFQYTAVSTSAKSPVRLRMF